MLALFRSSLALLAAGTTGARRNGCASYDRAALLDGGALAPVRAEFGASILDLRVALAAGFINHRRIDVMVPQSPSPTAAERVRSENESRGRGEGRAPSSEYLPG